MVTLCLTHTQTGSEVFHLETAKGQSRFKRLGKKSSIFPKYVCAAGKKSCCSSCSNKKTQQQQGWDWWKAHTHTHTRTAVLCCWSLTCFCKPTRQVCPLMKGGPPDTLLWPTAALCPWIWNLTCRTVENKKISFTQTVSLELKSDRCYNNNL